MLKKSFVSAALVSAILAAGSASADTTDKRIALSNNYAGNSWRQAMLKSWEKVTKKAVADGIVKEAPAFTTAENQATEQAAQIAGRARRRRGRFLVRHGAAGLPREQFGKRGEVAGVGDAGGVLEVVVRRAEEMHGDRLVAAGQPVDELPARLFARRLAEDAD